MQENSLPGVGFEIADISRRDKSGLFLFGRKVPLVDDSMLVTARHNLHAAVGHRGIVQCYPDGDEGIGIDPPALAYILVPAQVRTLFRRTVPRRFVHEHRTKKQRPPRRYSGG